jgi:hypothetical protein
VWLIRSTILPALVLPVAAALADDSEIRDFEAELHTAIYGYAICEYCGLNSYEVHDGYRRETGELQRSGNLSKETVRRIWIRAQTDADLEWGNRGLGGFRNWCRTEGMAAAARFVAYRTAQMAQEQAAQD